jgi:xanthine dehydrogenase FAD-binding subunit
MKVVSARTLDEALRALRDAGPDSRVLAGGTDLMVEMESGRTRPDFVVDVWKVSALRGIRATARGIEIGALTTCADLERSAEARAHADILVEAARWVGAAQIKNRATIGGNLGTASPAADLNPVLFALGARVKLVSLRGERDVAVEAFVKGYRTTDRALDELIASIVIPARSPRERRAFRKVGTRKAQSISKVVLAVCAEVDAGSIRSVRAAAGSVADRTILLSTLSKSVASSARGLGAERVADVAREAVRADARPRDDVRSSAEYRTFALERILARVLLDFTKLP